jgi:hypothetical protein
MYSAKVWYGAGRGMRKPRSQSWRTAQGFRSPEEEGVNRMGALRSERVEHN